MGIVVFGIDLGNNLCSAAGLDASGQVVLRRRLKRGEGSGVCAAMAVLFGGDGSLLWGASSGSSIGGGGARGAADVAGVCTSLH